MYDEMRFLFAVDPYIRNSRNNSNQNRVVNNENPVVSENYVSELDEEDKNLYLNKYIITKGDVKNYIRSDVNRAYRENSNPYIDLIKFTNESNTAKSLRLRSSDFAYLRDIGVMPINRLMILRRFPEGATVPVDLSNFNVTPISVVIGWVKRDTELLKFSFSEVWEKQGSGDMLHLMLNKIVKDEFGLDMSSIVPIPGWGLGFMFGILNRMGLTDYSKTDLPIGDPNVLKESITRPHEQFGLKSSFNFDLETVYEQKYISGIDPTVAMLEILNNLLRMGTSDVRYLGKKNSEFIEKLRKANEDPTNAHGWTELSSFIVTSFIDALKDSISDAGSNLKQLMGAMKPAKEEKDDVVVTETRRERREREAEEKAERERKQNLSPEAKKNEAKKKSEDQGELLLQESTSFISNILETDLVKSILASTLARYKWPIRGSISMFTGDANTPWHLTIGNPYAPLLSMNNIYVEDVSVTGGKDLGYNDMPKTLDVKIRMTQGRSLGKQEIYSLFGVRYKRYYAKAPIKKEEKLLDR